MNELLHYYYKYPEGGLLKMKKLIALILVAMMALSLVACGNTAGGSNAATLKEGVTLQSIGSDLAEKYQMAANMELSKDDIATLLELDAANIEEAYGMIAMMNVSADHYIAIKATSGNTQAVADALQARLKFEQDTFSQYLPGVYEKTLEGKVITIGDYVFMFILGRDDMSYADEAASIETDIKAGFNS